MRQRIINTAAFVTLAASILGLVFSTWSVRHLFLSASIQLHHEGTIHLQNTLIAFCTSTVLFLVFTALMKRSPEFAFKIDPDTAAAVRGLPDLVFLTACLYLFKLLIANEAFVSLFAQKDLSVHATEIVMFPESNWLDPSIVITTACLLLLAISALLLMTMPGETGNGEENKEV